MKLLYGVSGSVALGIGTKKKKIKKKEKTNYSHEMQSLDFNVAATSGQ